ncbi:MAG: anti-sigma factor family protein [Alphaproteobacteria bacterium]
MNCREAEKLLDGYFDGELDGDSMREAAVHVAHCGSCEAELASRDRVQGLLRASVADSIEGLDFDRVWRGIETAIEDGASVSRRSESFWRSAKPRGAAGAESRSRAAEAAVLDPRGDWLHRGSRVGAWSWAAAAALAAGLAGFVAVRGLPGAGPADQVASGGPAARVVARAEAPPSAPAQRLAEAPLPAPGGPLASGRRGRIAVDSVDFEGNSLAMWSEPETDTTVIWIDEDEPSGAGVRLR